MIEKSNKNIEKYIKLLQWPFLLILVFEICAMTLDYPWLLFWVANIVFYVYISYNLRQEKIGTMAWIGGITAFLLSFTTAFIELIFNFKFWYIFNLITQPIIYAVIGALLISLIHLIINKLTETKGGENNGTTK